MRGLHSGSGTGYDWRAEARRRQGGRLEESSGGRGEGESSASGLNISRAEAALEKALRMGWFSRQQELEAGENIRQTKAEIRATRDQNMRAGEGFVIVL